MRRTECRHVLVQLYNQTVIIHECYLLNVITQLILSSILWPPFYRPAIKFLASFVLLMIVREFIDLFIDQEGRSLEVC